MKRINEIETAKRLQKVFEKRQKRGIIPKEDAVFFNSKVIQAYESAPIAQIKIEDNSSPFLLSSPALPHQLSLYRLWDKKPGSSLNVEMDSRILEKIQNKDESMARSLASMSSTYAILPDEMSPYQIKQTSQLEILFSYAATYIAKNTWGKEFCSLIKIDNQLKPLLNAWSEHWLQIYKLCQNCRDFLNKAELTRLLRASDWLNEIVNEHRRSVFMFLYSSHIQEINNKGYLAAENRDFAKDLEQGIIPEGVDSITQPHLYRLLEISISLADSPAKESNSFRDHYWKPYISSIRNWANIFERDKLIVAVWSKNGMTHRENRGRGIRPR